ncbi:aminotransferase class V-fold PLP-dependent enzyme [Flindersiella endophytica]
MTALDVRAEECTAERFLQLVENHDTTAEPTGPDQPLLPIVGADTLVPLVTGERRTYANLDYAASAPCLQQVSDHVQEVLPYYASVHRGAGYNSQVSTALYEGAREVVADFLDAREDDVVVFTRNTTDSLNLLAGCVPGDVLYLDIEHHANLLPWQRHGSQRCVLASTTQQGTLVALRAELVARPPALVAITGASNVTGEVLPIREIARLAHSFGARVVLDAAQLAPHRRISIRDLDVDYVAFSGHKLYAPLGSGVLVGRRDWLDEAPAYLAGGGAVREVRPPNDSVRTTWAAAPQRHEGGTPNVLGAAALARACQALAALPERALEEHEAALRSRLVDGLSSIEGVQLHQIWRDSPDAIGVVAFGVDGYAPGQVAAYLSAEHGVGVRDGKFCAHPLLSRLGLREGAVRASFGVGSTVSDVDRIVTGVRELVSHGPAWTYAIVDGRWSPSPDPRPRPEWLAPGAASPAAGSSPCEAAG